MTPSTSKGEEADPERTYLILLIFFIACVQQPTRERYPEVQIVLQQGE
jgi:hypothetical protein